MIYSVIISSTFFYQKNWNSLRRNSSLDTHFTEAFFVMIFLNTHAQTTCSVFKSLSIVWKDFPAFLVFDGQNFWWKHSL